MQLRLSMNSMDKSQIAVVILNFNGLKHLQNFFGGVWEHSRHQARVILADNASEDGSVDWVKSNYPQCEIIQLNKNYGFAGGYNKALVQVEAAYYVLLNSDVEVTANWIKPMVQVLDHQENVGAVQPKILAQQEKTLFEYAGAAGGWMDRFGYPFCKGRVLFNREKDEGQFNEEDEIFWSSGAAMIIRSSVYHGLGGLDDSYFAHMEEIDLCWRLQRAGYTVKYTPKSTVFHLGGGTLSVTSPFKTYLNFRNSLSTIFKNEPAFRALRIIFARLIFDFLSGIWFLFEGKWSHIWSIIKAHLYFYTHIGSLIKRKREYSQRIENVRRAEAKINGRFNGLLIWNYFIRRKTTFKNIVLPHTK